jgi:ferric-dicitrate binding protein FerR (iron transport regulator)
MHPSEEHFWSLVSLRLAGEAGPQQQAEIAQLLREHPEWSLRLELYTNMYKGRQKQGQTDENNFSRHLQRLSNHLDTPVLQYDIPAPQPSSTQPHLIPSQPGSTQPHPTPSQPGNAQPHATPSQPGNAQPHATPSQPGAAKLHTIPPQPDADAPRPGADTPPRRRIRIPLIGAAAAIIAIAAALYLIKPPARSDDHGLNTVSTRAGSRSKVQLPDGTIVWLNADSRITYKVNATEREVELTGEAYFDVAKDKAHPFRVHTKAVDILVLGTAFDVRSYTNEHNTEASLFQGSVEVTLRNSPDKKIILHPEEKITVNNNEAAVTSIKTKQVAEPDFDQPLLTLGKIHRQEKDSTITETLWTKNQLYFDNRTLEEVGFQLERWFGVRVTISDDNLKQRHISGDFKELSINEVMEALQYTGVLHYTIRKKEVIITP